MLLKRCIALVVIGLLILSMVACTENKPVVEEESKKEETPSQEVEQDQIEVRTAWFGSIQRHERFNKLMDMFEEKNPDIKVAREYADWGAYFDKLATQAASGNPPDVFQLTPLHLAEYAGRGVLLDLEQYVTTNKIDLRGWDPKIIDAGRYQNKLYMVTIGISAPAIFPNVDLLKRIGITLPDRDLDWQEFYDFTIETQKALDRAGLDAYALFDSGGNFDVFVIFAIQKGKTIVSEDGKKLGFSKEDVVEYLTWWDKLRKEGAIPPAEIMAEEGGKPWEDSMMVHQRVAMRITNGNQLKIFQSYMEDEVGIMRLPSMPEGPCVHGEVFTGVYLAISKTSKYPDAAARLINFWTNDIEANELYNLEHGILGSQKVMDALADKINPSDRKVIAHSLQIIKDAPAHIPRPQGYSAIASAFSLANNEVAFGKQSPDQAADTFMKEAEALLNK